MSYYGSNPLWDFFEAVANQVDNVQQQQDEEQRLREEQGQSDQRYFQPESRQSTSGRRNLPDLSPFFKAYAEAPAARKAAPPPPPKPAARQQLKPQQHIIPIIKTAPNAFQPPIDVYDTDKEYKIFVAVPGARKQTTEVHYNPSTNQLSIEGEVEAPPLKPKNGPGSSKGGPSLLLSERQTGPFARILHLPSEPRIDEDLITAKYRAGVLEVTVPKKSDHPQTRRKITVEELPDEELVYESVEHNQPSLA